VSGNVCQCAATPGRTHSGSRVAYRAGGARRGAEGNGGRFVSDETGRGYGTTAATETSVGRGRAARCPCHRGSAQGNRAHDRAAHLSGPCSPRRALKDGIPSYPAPAKRPRSFAMRPFVSALVQCSVGSVDDCDSRPASSPPVQAEKVGDRVGVISSRRPGNHKVLALEAPAGRTRRPSRSRNHHQGTARWVSSSRHLASATLC